ncbi:peptidylprolyl isomerase [Parabacteroides sp. 52]|uniref:FKBP-type peptidyl-prolyl cis-trans isomerase n=1 Tax=unclassified Parabacteroides TaxID=2649774 RepID=UPI0013D2A7B8|nr:MULTISPECIES: FKBP-type peptidyl-prolyl cis-trans isomerase [unclassified Parabacteroides]MDH6534609.1 FKBP-type peptidyl-prolyl cis-trans isomerase FkpA [Parabacteroides sp. PM5-20]NDV55158.1 peptidylprolyl isomerase [Parabacteroides sp. 52]
MRKLSLCVYALLAIMAISFIACNDDDDKGFTAEQLNYFQENIDYIREKKLLKDENGNLLYRQITYGTDTVLYRILEKTGEGDSIRLDSNAHMKMKGLLIDGTVFQQEFEETYQPQQLIPGIALVMMETCVDEKIEAIIPASLGYGYYDYYAIPGGSTLVFTYVIDGIQ